MRLFFLERAVYAFDGGGMLAGWLLTWPVTPYQMILLLYPFAGSFCPGAGFRDGNPDPGRSPVFVAGAKQGG